LFVYAVAGACLALLTVFLFANKRGKFDNSGMILSGIMVNAFCSALIMLMVILAGPKVNSIMFWLMGDIGSAALGNAIIIGIFLLLLTAVSLFFSNSLDALSLGDEQAVYLGINIRNLKITVFIISSLLTGLVVAAVGIIGFIGLVIPHISKMLLGEQLRKNIPLVLILGAGFTVLADLLSRTLIPDTILPIGILTAVIGVPFFILIYKRT